MIIIMKNIILKVLIITFITFTLIGCKSKDKGVNNQTELKLDENNEDNMEKDMNKDSNKAYAKLKVDENTTYQIIESFGASGAWWSQYVGGWDEPYGDGTIPVRDEIATLLYSKEEGIGLTAYRYNLGAGSADSGNGDFWHVNRRAQSFEKAPGVYDFTKDENAMWFLKKVVELGASEITLFCNSPLERLTVNGKAHMTGKNEVNIKPENYKDFATYVLDVTEYFRNNGIPVDFISPINEPQWDWLGGQEGCHYEPKEVVEVLKVFLDELQKREGLKDVELSAPESGEWGGRTIEYNSAILEDEVLGNYFHTIDNHSYWTNTSTKESYKRWQKLNYPNLKLRTSEWCEMVNGKDYTMDSAFNMADVIHEDLTILDVVSWQKWVAVADGDYRDGLIYINQDKKAYRASKRLWAFGNFSKFVRPGYQRVETNNAYSNIYNMKSIAFTGTNEEGKDELVIVLINREEAKEFKLDINTKNSYNSYAIHSTTMDRDLEKITENSLTEDSVMQIEAESITTIVLSNK